MIKTLEHTATKEKPFSILKSVLSKTAHREELRVSRPLRSALPFLLVSISLGALALFFVLYTPCYQLTVNGTPAGLVQGHEMVEQTAAQVEAQISKILGREYSLSLDLDYQFTVAAKEKLLGYALLSDQFYSAVPDVKEAYVLSVDGRDLGASADKAVLDEALSAMQAPYLSEQTVEVYFANEARVTRKYIPATESFSEDAQFVKTLSQHVPADTVYEVKAGDSIDSVSAAFGMSRAQLLERNPNLKTQSAPIAGQVIRVQRMLPLLSVCSVDQLTYTREVKSPLREVQDNSLYEGERKLLTQGMAGSERVRANMNYVNGIAQYEEILSSQVVKEATETVVAVGTKVRPPFYSTGSIRWPCEGQITSPFGYRNIFGSSSFHSGMDIAKAYGTPIYAADSGIVTFVGYKGSYGNLVIIDHGNGWETYYSHGSASHVTVGQGVYQGDLIASMGATGRATGNHCHFELRIHGEAVNPQGYLP